MMTPENDLILGVLFKPLRTFRDDRGFFREVVRNNDPFFSTKVGDQEVGSGEPFRQWSHSRMVRDTVKAWHYHHVQFDWWYLGIGHARTVLIDNRPESPTYRTKLEILMGDSGGTNADIHEVCVRIPPGVLHGLKVLSEEAHLFYITSEIYNPQEEGRIPFNDPEIGYDWGANVITVENDRRAFEPVAPRIPLRH